MAGEIATAQACYRRAARRTTSLPERRYLRPAPTDSPDRKGHFCEKVVRFDSNIEGGAMTSQLTRPPATTVRPEVASRRDDTIGVLFGMALVGGVLADAWAHTNIRQTLESFFTPWHALLYGGFAATAAWTWWLAFRHRREDVHWRNGWPAGYGVGAVGTLLFLVGGVADMFWHTIFGIETGLKAGLSPSHLTIAAGGVLLLTSQLRSWWASGEGGWRSVTGVLSAALGTMMGVVVIVGLTGIYTTAPTRAVVPGPGSQVAVSPEAQGALAYLIATVLLLIPFMLIHRRRPAPGAATAITGVIGLFLMAQHEFPMPIAAIVGMIAGAAIVDAVLWRLDQVRGTQAPLRLPIAGAVFGAGIWIGHLTGLQLAAGVRWPPEIWAGTVVLSAILGALLGVLAAGKPVAQPTWHES